MKETIHRTGTLLDREEGWSVEPRYGHEKIAVVIPCYKARSSILEVLSRIGVEVDRIYVVDDACPERTGQYVSRQCTDPRVRVLHNDPNLGVGGAVMHGYRNALKDGMDIIVKLDADGQMDPAHLRKFVQPIKDRRADYTKGNRFYDLAQLKSMPRVRLLGNGGLSFFTKLSSGYWNLMDPTNGYTAIHAEALKLLPLDKIAPRYFFESDMLFRLNTVRAVVMDIPMEACYANEPSQLSVWRAGVDFPAKHLLRLSKRVFYNYFLREFNIATIELIFGSLLFILGAAYGAVNWYANSQLGIATTSGTVMLAALPMILGFQLLLSALNYDVNHVPRTPLGSFFGKPGRHDA